MRRGLATLVASVSVLLAMAAPAAAQQTLLYDQDVLGIAERARGSFSIDGQVTVTYRGPGVEGTTTYRPPGEGDLFAVEFRTRDGRARALHLFGRSGTGGTTIAQVLRTGPDGSVRRCTDARTDRFGGGSFGRPGAAYTLDLPGRSGVRTRCGGPTLEDLRGALPPRTLSPSSLAPGARTIDLRSERPFSAGGLTGTVRSSMVLRVRSVRRQPRPRRAARRPSRVRRVELAVGAATGDLTMDLAVPGDAPGCDALLLCGLAGTKTLSLGSAGVAGAGELIVPRGRRTGYGLVELTGATTRADVRTPDGLACTEDAPARPTGISLRLRRDRVDATLVTLDEIGLGLGRCPGPARTDLGSLGTLAEGSFPRSALSQESITLRLRGSSTFGGALARGRTRGELVVQLRRRGA